MSYSLTCTDCSFALTVDDLDKVLALVEDHEYSCGSGHFVEFEQIEPLLQ